MNKERKDKINRKRLIITITVILLIMYVIYTIILLRNDKSESFFVEQGTIHKEEAVVGYIIRNETVIRNEEDDSGIIQIATEGQRVSKDDAIFEYYNNDAKELYTEIENLNIQIQETLKKEKNVLSSDIKFIETQIEENIERLSTLNNMQELTDVSKMIKNLLEKKTEALKNEANISDNLKELSKQREDIYNEIRKDTKYITAPISGMLSYRVDGLEEKLNMNSIEEIEIRELEKLNLKTGQIIATSSESGKVIDNFKYYIITSMNSEEAKKAQIGDKVELRLATNDEIRAKIIKIKDEEENKQIVFEIDRLTEKLADYRKISFDVIWWSDSGLKVPNKAIIKSEDGLSYIIRTRSGYLTKLLVKIANSNENYSIVTSYNSKELTEIGQSQEEISSYKKVKQYDEILLYPKKEHIK